MYNRKFDVSFATLFAVTRLGWNNCRNFLAAMHDLRPIYTDAYITAMLEELDMVSEMPNADQRSAEHELLRVALVEEGEKGMAMWRKLRRYGVSAYTPAQRKAMLKDMGRGYLAEANNENWNALDAMLLAGKTFIEENEAKLLANNNMPATFKELYIEQQEAFQLRMVEFFSSEEGAIEGTKTTTLAANTMYDKLMIMLGDGQEAVRPESKDQFVFERLTAIVSPTGPAGLKGEANFENGTPAVGIVVELENQNLSVVVDPEGVFDFGNKVKSGKDKMVFKKGDQILKEEDVVIPPGVTVREDVELPTPPPVV